MGPQGTETEVVLFDLGGVLVELTGVPQMLEWCAARHDEQSLARSWLASEAVRRFETGNSDPLTFARAIIGEMQLNADADTFIREFTAWPKALFPGVTSTITRLRQSHRTACFSNTNELHWPRLTGEMAIDELFEHLFASHHLGVLKPDPEAFRLVIDALKCDPGAIFFIDDNEVNVAAARAEGINAYCAGGFEEAQQLLRLHCSFDG